MFRPVALLDSPVLAIVPLRYVIRSFRSVIAACTATNPVICESVVQVGAQVNGNHQAITVGGQWGQLDLNVMKPMMARNLLESIELRANVSHAFVDKVLDGIEADEEACRAYIERSTAIATKLNPYIGYEKAAEVAKASYRERKPVREVVVEMGLMEPDEVEEALDIRSMTEPERN
jgi:fumarate hydratase class II